MILNMHRTFRYAFILSFIVWSCMPFRALSDTVIDSELKPEDFAYRAPLILAGKSSMFVTYLTNAIYLGSIKSDHGDIRIFNNSNEMVPFIIRKALDYQEQVSIKELAFLPYTEAPNATQDSAAMTVRAVSKDASVHIQVNNKEESNSPTSSSPSSIVLDLQNSEGMLKSLNFEWESANVNQIIHLRIETSYDLARWSTMIQDAVIAKLSYNNELLEQSKVTFFPHKIKYMKISFRADPSFKLNKILGEFVINRPIQTIRHWINLMPLPENMQQTTNQDKMNEVEFDAKGFFPVDQLKINLPLNSLQKVQVYSKQMKTDSWQWRYSGTVYHLIQDNQNLYSDPIQLQRSNDRFWLIRSEGKDINLQALNLTIALGWLPDQLVFLAQGAAPFFIAYGSANASLPDFGFNPALNLSSAILKTAVIGHESISGGLQRLQVTEPIPVLPWKQWLLWIILLLAVVLLGIMAWKLYKESKESP